MLILEEVLATVKDRQKIYSDFAETMKLTGELASKALGKEITGADVAIIYALNKLVRNRTGKKHRDNLIDAIAYIAILDEL